MKLGKFTVKKNTYEHMNDNIEIYGNSILPMVKIIHRVERTDLGVQQEYLEIEIINKKLVRIRKGKE